MPNAPRASAIAILFADVPAPLSEILEQALHEQPDMRLVANVTGNLQVLFEAGWDIDIVILGADAIRPLPAIGNHLLSHFPHLRIIVMSPGSDQAMLYWLGMHRRCIKNLSMQSLLHNIRQIASVDEV